MKKKIFYKPVIVNNFPKDNYINYIKSKGDRKTLSVEEYINENKPYLKDIINDLKNLTSVKFN